MKIKRRNYAENEMIKQSENAMSLVHKQNLKSHQKFSKGTKRINLRGIEEFNFNN
jgi:hypothetical protein